jgi:hypothetical protein
MESILTDKPIILRADVGIWKTWREAK